MIKKILGFLILFLVFSFKSPVAFAEGEFATSYDVLYDVGGDGVTTVTEKITLKNLTTQYYANQFKLTIGATQITDIKASDLGGLLEATSEQKNTSTTIAVKFNQQVVGMGKILPWTLTFKSKDFAEKQGKIWEVRTPKISSFSNLDSYNLTLSVPQSFGQPSSISPTPRSQTASEGKIFLTFNKDQLLNSGISANFGTKQIFDFDLSYHLENNNLVPILTNIALPPDTPFQDVVFQRVDPRPLNITVDSDGNYLAWYRLSRGQKLDVKVFGSAKLYTNSKVKDPVLDSALEKKYTKSDKYWDKDNPQITEKLAEILGKNPPHDQTQRAKLIFQYVVNTLKYNPGRIRDKIERLGAVTALSNPDSAICMEFTDLFIALARAANIPARELDGYAYSANTTLRPLSLTKDILHAWPEYWDEREGWVMIDPTWQNTTGGVDYFSKFDLNHIVFAIKGSSSLQPAPAGSYKYTDQDSHDVKVTLSENDFLGRPQINVGIETSQTILAGFPAKLKVKIVNAGDAFFPSTPLTVSTGNLSVLNPDTKNTGLIPAFGDAQFDFDIRTKSLFDSYADQIIIMVGNQRFSKEVIVKPFVLFQTIPLMIGAVLGLMILVYLLILGGLLYRRRILKSK